MTTGYTAGPAPWTQGFDRSRLISLTNAKISSGDPQRNGEAALLPPSLSFGSAPMFSSYSSESHLNTRKRASKSPPYALPPLKSLVNGINGDMEADTPSRYLPRPPGMDRKASSTQGVRLRRASHAAGMSDHYTNDPKVLLGKIYASSIALADYAQDTQHTADIPTLSEVDKMQQLASDLNLNLRDLQYQVDVNDSNRPFEVIQSKYDPPPSVLQDGYIDGEQRRRSSGGTSFVSFDMGHINGHRRQFSSATWDPLAERRHSASYSRFNGRYPDTDTSGYSDHSRYHESQDTSVTTDASKTSPSSYNSDVPPKVHSSHEQSRAQKYRKRSRAAAPGSCSACNVEETPEWRNGPSGKRTLCNACGLHYSKMVRKKKSEVGGDEVAVSIDELRASILLPATSTNGSDKGSING